MNSRREFLRQAGLISLAPTVPLFLQRLAVGTDDKRSPAERILVVVQLDGGNDGLNTIVPYRDPAYAQHRPRLRLPEAELHKVADQWAMHPAMRGMSELFNKDRLAIVHGVGYPNPNRSHFESMKIWHAASTDSQLYDQNIGWLGSALGSSLSAPGKSQCIHIGDDSVPVALRGRRCHCVSLAGGEDMHLNHAPSESTSNSVMPANPLAEFVLRDVSQAYATAEKIRSMTTEDSSSRYPGSKLAQKLQSVSQLIKSDSSAHVYYVLQGGYDTHAAQLPNHEQLLSALSNAIKAFMDDMRASGLEDQVLLMCFSEFGRRVAENDSLGTDHGAAGPMLLAGTKLASKSIGQLPSLSDLDHGDLRFTIDFRDVYASILTNWLQLAKPETLSKFQMNSLFRSSAT